jgi:hypothetical protein
MDQLIHRAELTASQFLLYELLVFRPDFNHHTLTLREFSTQHKRQKPFTARDTPFQLIHPIPTTIYIELPQIRRTSRGNQRIGTEHND